VTGPVVIPEFDPVVPDPFLYKANGRVVWAVRLTEENLGNVWEWADSKPFWGPGGNGGPSCVTGLTIWSIDGNHKAEFGDWVVKFPWGFERLRDGEFWAICEPMEET
jgi:hypothetical protein